MSRPDIAHKVGDFTDHDAFEQAITECVEALMTAVEAQPQIDFRVVAEAARYVLCMSLANLRHQDGTVLIANPAHLDEFMGALNQAMRRQFEEMNTHRLACDLTGTLVPQAKGVH